VSFLPLAHALASRQDLPIPEWLFAWGASIVLIVSFFALSVAWREPRFERDRWRPLGAGLSRALLGPPAQILCGAIGVFLLGVAVYAGLRGTEAPDRNFALTLIVGLVVGTYSSIYIASPIVLWWARRSGTNLRRQVLDTEQSKVDAVGGGALGA